MHGRMRSQLLDLANSFNWSFDGKTLLDDKAKVQFNLKCMECTQFTLIKNALPGRVFFLISPVLNLGKHFRCLH